MLKKIAFLAAFALVAAPALAGPTGPVYNIAYNGQQYGGQGGGGAFRFTTVAPNVNATGSWGNVGYSTGQSFYTFCVEDAVTGIGQYATIDDTIYYDTTGSKDLNLALYTDLREVYATYIEAGGGNAGLGALGLTQNAAGNVNLQNYIWTQLLYAGHNPGAAVTNPLNAISNSNYTRVLALNTWDTYVVGQMQSQNGHDKQSQLIYVTTVPAPGAALLGLIGLAGVRWMRRRIVG